MERYVRQNRHQREQYDCIERAFNALKHATKERPNDNFSNKYIPVCHPAIQSPGTFQGIKRMRFARLDWHDIDHRADIAEFTDRRIAELRGERDRAGAVIVDLARALQSETELREQLRQHEIQALLEKWIIPDDCRDLHGALHYYLSSHLEALDWIMALPIFNYRARFQHNEIIHGELALSYHSLIPSEIPTEETI